MKIPFLAVASFKHTQAFLGNTRGQITIGEIPLICRATLATEGNKVRVARFVRCYN
jgi:hypothetical protein